MRELGARLVDEWNKVQIVKTKGKEGLDLATELDRRIEKELVQHLSGMLPGAGYIVEEHEDFQKSGQYQWVVDPIDGTKYYASGIPLFGISVGLVKDGNPVMGAIYVPTSDQLYVGGTDIPAMLNGTEISVRQAALDKSMISFELGQPEKLGAHSKWEHPVLNTLLERSYRVRMFGCGALSLAWLSSGSIINVYIAITPPTKFVDIAAGLAIAAAAGAKILQIPHPYDQSRTVIVVGSTKAVEEIQEVL